MPSGLWLEWNLNGVDPQPCFRGCTLSPQAMDLHNALDHFTDYSLDTQLNPGIPSSSLGSWRMNISSAKPSNQQSVAYLLD